MAEDIINEGSEEEENTSKDDDFGLPDLEFDDLQELDMSGDDSEEESDKASDEPVSDLSADSGGVQEFDMSLVEGLTSDEPELGSGLQEGDLDPPTDPASVLDEGIDEVEDVLDSAQLISDRLGEEDGDSSPITGEDTTGINYDELIGSPSGSENLLSDVSDSTEDSQEAKDLFADIDSPDDLAALGFADEESSEASAPEGTVEPQVPESDSLFGSEAPVEESGDSLFGSDSLALEAEEKIEFDSSEGGSLPPNYKSYTYEESSGGFTKIVVIGIVGIAIIASALLYFNNQKKGDEIAGKKVEKVIPKKSTPAPKAKAESTPVSESKPAAKASTAEAKPKPKPKPQPKAENRPNPKPKPRPEAVTAAASAQPGEIIRIAERTSKSYVIVASFVDEDMAMDYATELSGSGKGVKIIEPYGKSKRFRVSIADFPTYGDAASQLADFKPEYGEDVWALKY